MSILDKIVAQRLKDVAAAKDAVPLAALQAQLDAAPPAIDFVARLRLAQPRTAVLAEVKRASPSKGDIAPGIDAAEQGLKYATAGASAISVLTEPTWFKGHLRDMLAVRRAVDSMGAARPAILRKDFLLDEYQLVEARVHGADTVLLIVKSLDQPLLLRLIAFARSLGMEPLVEVNNPEEMGRAVEADARVIGVNNRNLNDFNVDLGTTSRLAALVANKDVIVAALSGITGRPDVVRYEAQGIRAVLVGEALMRAEDPRDMVMSLIGVSRPLVKICGIKDPEMALHTKAAGADFIGLVFADKSKRRVSVEEARQIVAAVRKGSTAKPLARAVASDSSDAPQWFASNAQAVSRYLRAGGRVPLVVGVFADQDMDEVNQIAEQVDLDVIQLSGMEGFEVAKRACRPCIKAVHVGDDGKGAAAIEAGKAEMVLLDTKGKGGERGGTGVAFDWDVARKVQQADGVPLFLAGGLTVANIADAVAQVAPWAVDVSSGVEAEPGVKDEAKIRDFVKRAKGT